MRFFLQIFSPVELMRAHKRRCEMRKLKSLKDPSFLNISQTKLKFSYFEKSLQVFEFSSTADNKLLRSKPHFLVNLYTENIFMPFSRLWKKYFIAIIVRVLIFSIVMGMSEITDNFSSKRICTRMQMTLPSIQTFQNVPIYVEECLLIGCVDSFLFVIFSPTCF